MKQDIEGRSKMSESELEDGVHVTQGDEIPKCPNGHTEFDSRTNEPDTKG